MKYQQMFVMSFFLGFVPILSGQSGNDCGTAINLGTLTSPYQGTTVGATNTFTQNCLSTALDRVLFIDVPAGQILSIGQTANNYDSQNRVAYGGNCPGETLIDCWDDPDNEQIVWVNSTGIMQRVWWIQNGSCILTSRPSSQRVLFAKSLFKFS